MVQYKHKIHIGIAPFSSAKVLSSEERKKRKLEKINIFFPKFHKNGKVSKLLWIVTHYLTAMI